MRSRSRRRQARSGAPCSTAPCRPIAAQRPARHRHRRRVRANNLIDGHAEHVENAVNGVDVVDKRGAVGVGGNRETQARSRACQIAASICACFLSTVAAIR